MLLPSGCGGSTQVSGPYRALIVSLATAVSSRDAAGLESNATLIERRRSEGGLSPEEYEAFRSILTKAKAGDWESAEEEAYALRDGQTPTAEDLDNLAKRKLPPEYETPKTLRKGGRW
ncbi:MAG: hypothetical protein BGO49_26235 [Planctomycetales bacterium 71-10]|nr:MAG: hypothetical protein BGO49_26235 [Planctomycetales bacterium 71-10]